MAGALTAAIAAAFSGGAAVVTDEYFEYTTLLLPGNGTNGAQNNTFLDGSTNNFTITRNGNTTQGTFSPFSQTGWGNYFDGTGDYLTVPDNAAWDLGSSNFTIESWVYPTASPLQPIIIGQWTTSYSWLLTLSNNTNRYLRGILYNGSFNDYVSTSSLTLNAWNHCAMVRESNTVSLYLNGSRVFTTTFTGAVNTSTSAVSIGANASGADPYTGYLSNARVVIGTALYSGVTYTVPTAPLTAITNTALLTCQSNRFIDNSTNNFTITRNGDTRVVAFSPFNPTASWSAATYGGSGYFDGSGDYLNIADNAAFQLGTNSFCIEGWFFPTTTGDGALISKWATTAANAAWNIVRISGTLYCQLAYGASSINATTTDWPLNQWSHIAFVRNGSTLSAYLNGTRFYTNASFSNTINVGVNGVTVGTQSGGTSYPFTGYLSGFRVVNGSAVYDPTSSTITVPTAPLTAITNTSLLLNFTNAGIYDATSKNDLETVGNAQISTTQSKWGGSSMSFDGTGDWLLIPDQPPQRIGTGNFTVEMWVYRNSSGTYGLAGKGTGTTGWLVSLNSSNQVVFTYGSSTITSSGTVSATTWTHIAVVREGTSTNQTKIYISGTNDGTGTVSTDFNQTNSMYIGADRTGGSAANAYVQDVRITNYARYTSNFTAPTAAFPTL